MTISVKQGLEKIITLATVDCNTFDCGFLKYSTWLGKCFSLHQHCTKLSCYTDNCMYLDHSGLVYVLYV